MKIGEGTFRRKPQILYIPKAVVTALELWDGDIIEFHVRNGAVEMVKKK